MKTKVALAIGVVMVGTAVPAMAQARQASSQEAPAAVRDRYQIGLMETIFQRAAEHGAKVTRDRVQAVIPADMLLSDEVRVKGLRLDSYGVLFYIDMPDLQESTSWIYKTLDQNNLGLASAWREIRSALEASGTLPSNVRQAVQRVDLELAPAQSVTNAGSAPGLAGVQTLTGSAANVRVDRTTAVDPVINDPQSVYRTEVKDAIIEAMLDHSNGLRLDPKDWLTVAIRGKENPVRLSQADTESPTITISIRGEDLTALLSGQISREEAIKRVVFKQN